MSVTPSGYFEGRSSRYWADLYEGEPRNHYQVLLRRRREIAVELIAGVTGPALELGCGPGVLVDALLPRGSVFLGDISYGMIAEARRRLGANTGAQMSATRLPFLDASFDLVTAVGVLQYVGDERAALDEIARVLRPGGTAVLTFPAPVPIEYALRAAAQPMVALARRVGGRPAPALRFDASTQGGHALDEALRMIDRAGLDVATTRAFHYFYFPWSRLFFGLSRRVDRLLDRAARRWPGTGRFAQSWVIMARKPA